MGVLEQQPAAAIRQWLTGGRLNPSSPAVVGPSGVVSYADLLRRADTVAKRLIDTTEPGQVVAVHASPGLPLTVAALGALMAGRVLTLMDRRLPIARIADLLALCRPALVLTDESSAALEEAPTLSLLELDADPSGIWAKPPRKLQEEASYIFFTSGSTGRPKGVIGTFGNLKNFVDWSHRTFGISRHDRFAQVTRPSFDVILQDLFIPLTAGGVLVFPPEEDVYSGEIILPYFKEHKVTALNTVPSVLRQWLSSPPPSCDLPDLRWVFSIGEPLDAALVERWRNVVGRFGNVVNLYGTTETGFESTWHIVGDEPRNPVPAGRPIDQTRVHILDDQGLRSPDGLDGEVWIEVAPATLGYLDETPSSACYAMNHLPDTISPLLYRTGDRGRIECGELIVLGRLDDELKINGVRMQPREIAAKLETHVNVGSAAVIAIMRGERKQLVGAYVPAEPDPGAEVLRSFLADCLPPAFVPGALIALSELPLNNNGKVDKAALAAMFDEVDQEVGEEGISDPPLAQIIGSVLGRPVRWRCGFIDQGGDSLAAAVVASRANAELGYALTMLDVLLAPTLEALGRSHSADLPSIASSSPHSTAFELSTAQKEYAALCMRTTGSWCNLAMVVAERPRDEQLALRAPMDALLATADVFRLRVAEDLTHQILDEEVTCEVESRDAPGEPDSEIARTLLDLSTRELDPRRNCGRMVFLTAGDKAACLFAGHHLFFDGASMELIALSVQAGALPSHFREHVSTAQPVTRKLSSVWAEHPFRLDTDSIPSTETWQFVQDVPAAIFHGLRDASAFWHASLGELVCICLAKYFSDRLGRQKALILQPKADRSFHTARVIGNFARQAFVEIGAWQGQRADEVHKALNEVRQPFFIDPNSLPETPAHLLPFTSLIFNYQPAASLPDHLPSRHTPVARGGLWELQLAMHVGADRAFFVWNYRASSFSARAIEGIATEFMSLLESTIALSSAPPLDMAKVSSRDRPAWIREES